MRWSKADKTTPQVCRDEVMRLAQRISLPNRIKTARADSSTFLFFYQTPPANLLQHTILQRKLWSRHCHSCRLRLVSSHLVHVASNVYLKIAS